jgi:cation:H+ antiporter
MGAGLLILAGLAALVLGGEVLVRGAGGLARSIGMSPLLVGLTVVAFATSAPELAVSLDATLDGSPGLAVGNVVGSNIANVLLVLGVSALILPLAVEVPVIRRDIPAVAAVSLLTLVLALDGTITRLEGLLLVAAMVGYVVHTVLGVRRAEPTAGAAPPGGRTGAGSSTPHADDTAPSGGSRLVHLGLVGVGVLILVVGAGWLVDGATAVARDLGVSDLVIGLTVVAIGTSMPELATSVIAALRGARDLAVGNVVGSCILNLGLVLGLVAVVADGGVPVDASAVRFDLPFMVVTACALLPVAFTGLAISRWEGVLFVGYYLAYLTFLVLTATEHARLPAFSAAMLGFVIPLTAVSLLVVVVHELRGRRGRGSSPEPPPVAQPRGVGR